MIFILSFEKYNKGKINSFILSSKQQSLTRNYNDNDQNEEDYYVDSSSLLCHTAEMESECKESQVKSSARFYAMSLDKDRNSIRKCQEHIFQECI